MAKKKTTTKKKTTVKDVTTQPVPNDYTSKERRQGRFWKDRTK
jgi:hypothetical protein